MKEGNRMDSTDLKRRRFLLSAGATGVAAGVVVATAGKDAPSAPAQAEAAPAKSGGYSETAHVRNYYRTTRI